MQYPEVFRNNFNIKAIQILAIQYRKKHSNYYIEEKKEFNKRMHFKIIKIINRSSYRRTRSGFPTRKKNIHDNNKGTSINTDA